MYPDPQGGLFHTSAGRKLAGENGFIDVPALNQTGWKVRFCAMQNKASARSEFRQPHVHRLQFRIATGMLE